MKVLLTILISSLLMGCGRKHPLIVNTLWQCNNQTLMIAAFGGTAEGEPAKYIVYSDSNMNQVFDKQDEQISQQSSMVLHNNTIWMTQPIKITESWQGRYLFVKVCTANDTIMKVIPRCNGSVTSFTN